VQRRDAHAHQVAAVRVLASSLKKYFLEFEVHRFALIGT
jgi:hypothetical protein